MTPELCASWRLRHSLITPKRVGILQECIEVCSHDQGVGHLHDGTMRGLRRRHRLRKNGSQESANRECPRISRH